MNIAIVENGIRVIPYTSIILSIRKHKQATSDLCQHLQHSLSAHCTNALQVRKLFNKPTLSTQSPVKNPPSSRLHRQQRDHPIVSVITRRFRRIQLKAITYNVGGEVVRKWVQSALTAIVGPIP